MQNPEFLQFSKFPDFQIFFVMTIIQMHEFIVSPTEIANRLKQDGLNVWLCTHGGCASNTLALYLESLGYRIRTHLWHEFACHAPYPILDIPGIKLIYLYSADIECARDSQLRRDLGMTNLSKLTNTKNVTSNDLPNDLLNAMHKQVDTWTSIQTNSNLSTFVFEDLFTNNSHSKRLDAIVKLSNFLDDARINETTFPKAKERITSIVRQQ